MWRKKIILVFVTLFIVTATAVVAVAPVGTTEVDYLEDKLFFVDGNITLVFDPVTPDPESDLTVIKMFYSPGEDVTVYQVQSNKIVYDWTFNNNTHNYGYFIQGTTDRYLIKVDYSSIQVPASWLDLLNETIAEKDQIITGLIVELDSTRSQLDIINQTLGQTKVEMEEWKAASNVLKDQRDTAIANEEFAKSQFENQKNKNEDLEDKWKLANSTVLNQNSRINNLETILDKINWATFYDYNDKTITVFNFPSMLVGVILCILLLVIFRNKLGLSLSNPLLLSIPNRLKSRIPKDQNKHVLSSEYGTDSDTIKKIEQSLVMDGITKKETPIIPKIEKDVKIANIDEKGGVNGRNSENGRRKKKGGTFMGFVNKKVGEGMSRKDAAEEWRRQKTEGLVK